MKKVKFLTLALVVAVMMMGAGYAYWSDTLTVKNTVKTGEFDVTFVEDSSSYTGFERTGDDDHDHEETTIEGAVATFTSEDEHDHEDGEEGGCPWYEVGNYLQDAVYDISDNGKSVEFSISNMYPGTKAKFDVTAVNNGTIPAVIKGIDLVDVKGNQELRDALKVKVVVDGVGKGQYGSATLAELPEVLNNLLTDNNFRLEPQDELKIQLNFILSTDVTTAEEDTAKFKLKFDWGQHNETSN